MMFVGRPISDIQATDLNQEVLLSLFQDAFCERSRAELWKERQDVKTNQILRFLDPVLVLSV